MTKPAKELHLVRQVGKRKTRRMYILTEGHIPSNGDVLTFEGLDWTVDKIRDTQVFAVFSPGGGKLKQVFP